MALPEKKPLRKWCCDESVSPLSWCWMAVDVEREVAETCIRMQEQAVSAVLVVVRMWREGRIHSEQSIFSWKNKN